MSLSLTVTSGILILVCFFFSGATSLLYEVVWMRRLVLIFGSTGFAVSTILTAFMAGLSLGSFVLARFSHRFRRPFMIYGLIEIGIGAYALFIPMIFRGIEPVYVGVWPYLEPGFYSASLLRFLLGFLALILPTILMGGTLPLISQELVRARERVGLDVGRLYGFNTLGAVVGTGAAGFFLLPGLGMAGTESVAVFHNFLIGLVATMVSLSAEEVSKPGVKDYARRPAIDEVSSRSHLTGVLIVFGLSGLAAMVYEVAWTRILALILGSSTYAFTIMLLAFLIGLGFGSLLMARIVDRIRFPLLLLAALQAAMGVTVFLGEFLFNELPYFFLLIFEKTGPDFILLSLGQFGLAVLVMLPPTLLSGAAFPLIMRICTRDVHRSGYFVGSAYAVNTLGTVLGAFAAAFIFLPIVGIQGSLHLGIGINLISALILAILSEIRSGQRVLASAGVAGLLLITLVFRPGMEPLIMASGVYKDAPLYLSLYRSARDVFSGISRTHRLLFYREGISATVSVVEKPTLSETPHLVLTLDGKPDASTSADMSTQVLSGHLPLLVHPKAEKVLVVGLASGVTVGSVAVYPVKMITVAEIEPAMVEAQKYFSAFNHEPLKDHRVKVVLEDARNYLLRAQDEFDVIISEPSNPWMSGPAKLFTREFFIIGKKRLRPAGLFVQWVQLYGLAPDALRSLLRTFHSVFAHVLLFQTAPGDLILIGSAELITLNGDSIRKQLHRRDIREDLEQVGVKDEIDLLSRFHLGTSEIERFVGKATMSTDDNGLIEFSAPLTLYADTVDANLGEIRKVFRGVVPFLGGKAEKKTEMILALGVRHLESGELPEASIYAKAALSSGPSAVAHWILGEIYERQGNRLSASREWAKALQVNPRDYGANMSLALLSQSQGNQAQSLKHLASLAHVYPTDPVVATYDGIGFFLLGKPAAATHNLKEALAMLSRTGGDFEGQTNSLTVKIRALFAGKGVPLEVLLRYYLSKIYEQFGQKAEAERETGELTLALSRWREELARQPFGGEDSYLVRAMNFHERRASNIETERALVRLAAEKVASPLAHFYKGTTLYFLGYFEDALKELRLTVSTLDNGATYPLAEYYLGLTYYKMDKNEKGKKHLETFLRLTESTSLATSKREEVRRILGLPKRKTS